MISDIFAQITSALTSFASAVGSGITSVASMFYDPSAEAGAHITFLGTLLLIAVGAGIVVWAFRLIKGLVSRRLAK